MSGLELQVTEHTLGTDRPFTIARGTTTELTVTVVRVVAEDGTAGIGSASPSKYYGETPETVRRALETYRSVLESVGDPHQRARIERRCRERAPDNPAALAAVMTALIDLGARCCDQPLYRYLGLAPEDTPGTFHTIGIDEPASVRKTARKLVDRGFERLKLKVGDDQDIARLAAVREAAPEATLLVDANAAWTPDQAVSMVAELVSHDVAVLEQPVPADDLDGLGHVSEQSPIPIIADESCITATDVPAVADHCDGINIKLMKCGGPPAARRLVDTARAHDLTVLGGCMLESTASISAACHLAPLFDMADLDGALLVSDDPYEGVPIEAGEIALTASDGSGTGVRRHGNKV